jgi:hypothetical protein
MSNTNRNSLAGQPMPSARLDIENAADLAMLESIADAHAFEVWGNEIARGEPFPVADTNGDVRAYVFPYFRRFGERYPVMQVESGLTLVNQWLKQRTCEQHRTLCS